MIYYDLENIAQYIKADNHKVVLVADTIVANLYANKIKQILHKYAVDIITVPAGEIHKNRKTKADIEDKLLQLGCKRDTLLIALGGGVITDLAGFVAATFCRGIDIIYIPTTLMAMVDAAIGGKNGINTDFGKNMIGCIRQPNAIFIDASFLKTLDYSEYLYAYSEVIKHAIISECSYFEYLENNLAAILKLDLSVVTQIIKTSNQIKTKIVNSDPFDNSIRQILNLGHTYAHAIELKSNYMISHGRAVAMGLYLECQEQDKPILARLIKLFEMLGMEYTSPYSKQELRPLMLRDKKVKMGQAIY